MSVFLLWWFLQVCLLFHDLIMVMDSSLALSFSVCLSMYLCVERISCRGLEIRFYLFYFFVVVSTTFRIMRVFTIIVFCF
jgi:hypothetical protein